MHRKVPQYLTKIPELAPILDKADHLDVKTATGTMSMRQFIASMISYQPGWVTFLYRIRAVFVQFLGMRQEGVPQAIHMKPENLPMQAGGKVAFFKVRIAEEEHYWVVEAEDSHLHASLGVVVELLQGDQKKFYVITVVHYHNWAGPVYFNVIRPFHHIVVGSMVRAGATRRREDN